MTNAETALNQTMIPTETQIPTRESGFSKADEDKLNRLADESAARGTSTLKEDEKNLPGSTVVSNI